MKGNPAQRISIKPNFRIYLDKEVALGPGKAELLAHIGKTGSISAAARRMGMSYNRAWLLVRTMNACFKEPLVKALRGGETGGGAELTETGKRMTVLYQQLQSRTLTAVRPTLNQILTRLRK
jgi:molybdate transport system regulatory protein